MPSIDREKLEAYAQRIYERENEFSNYTLRTIARRIKATGELSAYDQEALKNIADISGDMQKITKELARITEMNIEDIERIYAQVVNDGVNSYKPLYDLKNIPFKPITENEYAINLVRHWAELTIERMINLSNTKALGFVDDNGNFTQLAGAFQQTIDDAVVAVSSGTTDFNSAMKGTIESLGGSGVQVWYGRGVHRSLESMVRQNLLYGAKKAAQSYDDYVSEDLGLDGFEVDAHAGCRLSHRFMQGQIYSINGDKRIDGILYKDGAEALKRLDDYNCLHFKTGVLLGVSEPRYSKEELERIEKETTEKLEYNGREKTLYEWKQTQRRLEREYRKAKTQSDMFKESGNNIAAKDYRKRAKAIKDTYDDLTDKVPGLYDNSARMRTYFKKSTSVKGATPTKTLKTDAKIKGTNISIDKDVSTSKINEEIFEKSTKQIENLESKFNIGKSNDISFGVKNNRNADGFVEYDTRKMKKQEINICERKNQNIDEVVAKQISRRNNGQIMPFADENASIYSVTHEYGHALQHSIVEKKIDWGSLKAKEDKLWETMTPKIKTKDDALKLKANADGIYRREISKKSREINNEIFEEARKIDSSFDVQKYASQYGLTNESELFAEAFANSQLGKPNVLGQAMNKWLERQGF